MEQLTFMPESINDALSECVRAIGGPKAVGKELKPERSIEAAAQWVRDCLNPTLPTRFTPEQVIWLLKRAKEVDCLVGIAFILEHCDCEPPKPRDPEDERARLQREFVTAQRQFAELAARMERVGLVRAA